MDSFINGIQNLLSRISCALERIVKLLRGTTDDGGAATVTPDPAAADPSVSLGQTGDPLAGTDDVADTTTAEEEAIVTNDTNKNKE